MNKREDLRTVAKREQLFSTLAKKEARGALQRLHKERQARMTQSAKDTEWEVKIDKKFAKIREEKAKQAKKKLENI
jgi:Leu/Phe-tRNA-protein transferase